MALPKMVTEVDYPYDGYSTTGEYVFYTLKASLIADFGWTLLFEDESTTTKAFVVTTSGGVAAIKVMWSEGSGLVSFEVAQSYTDIDTPVKRFSANRINTQYAEYEFRLVGDDKTIYMMILKHPEFVYRSTWRYNMITMLGEYKRYDGFNSCVVLGNISNGRYSTSSSSNFNYSGMVYHYTKYRKADTATASTLFYNMYNTDGSIPETYGQYTACNCVYAPGFYHIDMDDSLIDERYNTNSLAPLLLTKGYVCSAEPDRMHIEDDDYINFIVGELRGIRYVLDRPPIEDFGVTDPETFSAPTIDIDGKTYSWFCAYYGGESPMLLFTLADDWDLL